MRQSVFVFLFFLLIIPTIVCAGKKREFIKEYEECLLRVSRNYKEALRAPDSRFGKDYESGMQQFMKLSRSLQNGAKKWGADYNFQELAADIDGMYKRTKKFLDYRKDGDRSNSLSDRAFRERKIRNPYAQENTRNRKSKKRSSGSRSRDGDRKKEERTKEFLQEHDPLPILKIISSDLKTLEKSGFLEGGKPGQLLQKKIAVEEYKRLVDFYRNHYLYYLYRKISPQYEKEIRRRGELMRRAALNVMNSIGKKNGASLPCDLANETVVLLRSSDFYSAALAKRNSRGKTARSHHNRQEVNYSFKRIQETIAVLRKDLASFPNEEPAKQSKEISAEEKNLSPRELTRYIGKRRREIFNSNTLMNGVDDDTLRKFRSTLGESETKEFEKIRKEYVKNGYSDNEAARYSCIQLLNKGVKKMSANELQRIYRRSHKAVNDEKEKDVEL